LLDAEEEFEGAAGFGAGGEGRVLEVARGVGDLDEGWSAGGEYELIVVAKGLGWDGMNGEVL
jgi:hypothetical protein